MKCGSRLGPGFRLCEKLPFKAKCAVVALWKSRDGAFVKWFFQYIVTINSLFAYLCGIACQLRTSQIDSTFEDLSHRRR